MVSEKWFPGCVSLEYTDPGAMAPVALSEGSDGFFISPEGGWSVAQRVYSAIYGNVLAGQQVVVTDSHTPAPAATQVEPEPESMDPPEGETNGNFL